MSSDIDNMRKYICDSKLLHIATYSGGGIDTAAVWFATIGGDVSRLVFTSRDSRVHSENIRANGMFGASIVNIDLEGLGQKVQGVFVSGTAREASDSESREIAYSAYASRWPQVQNMFSVSDIESGATAMKMYVANVENFVWLDEARHPTSPKLTFSPAEL